jgi:hypothetical protein
MKLVAILFVFLFSVASAYADKRVTPLPALGSNHVATAGTVSRATNIWLVSSGFRFSVTEKQAVSATRDKYGVQIFVNRQTEVTNWFVHCQQRAWAPETGRLDPKAVPGYWAQFVPEPFPPEPVPVVVDCNHYSWYPYGYYYWSWWPRSWSGGCYSSGTMRAGHTAYPGSMTSAGRMYSAGGMHSAGTVSAGGVTSAGGLYSAGGNFSGGTVSAGGMGSAGRVYAGGTVGLSPTRSAGGMRTTGRGR